LDERACEQGERDVPGDSDDHAASIWTIIHGLPEYDHCLQDPPLGAGGDPYSDLQVLMMERAGWKDFLAIGHRKRRERIGATARHTPRARCARRPGWIAASYDLRDWGIENRFEIFKKHQSRYARGVNAQLGARVQPGRARARGGDARSFGAPELPMAALREAAAHHDFVDPTATRFSRSRNSPASVSRKPS